MKKSTFTEEQIAFALKQAETGVRGGEVRRVRQLEQENARLKKLVVER